MAGQLSQSPATPFQPLADIDPGRMAFNVLVPSQYVTPALLAQLVTTVTTLRQWSRLKGMNPDRVEEPLDDPPQSGRVLGDHFVYTHWEPAGGLCAFNFVQLRSATEISTPIPGKSYLTTDAMYWHSVMSDLYFEESRVEFDEFIINNQRKLLARVKAKMDSVPGGNFPTRLQVEFFASHKPFPDDFFQLDVPVPSLVQWHVRNESGSQTCLHPRIEFSDNVTAGPILPNCGAVGKAHQSGQPTIFPATNHTTWKNHVCYENVQQVQGLYFMERRTAYVPRGMKKLRGLAA
jgi:hypothetical protein